MAPLERNSSALSNVERSNGEERSDSELTTASGWVSVAPSVNDCYIIAFSLILLFKYSVK